MLSVEHLVEGLQISRTAFDQKKEKPTHSRSLNIALEFFSCSKILSGGLKTVFGESMKVSLGGQPSTGRDGSNCFP